MNQSHRFQRKTLAILLAGLLVFVAGCGNEAAPASAPVESEAETSAIRVLTTTASRGDLSRGTEFVGRLEAAESVKVFPKSQGQIVHTYFSAGDAVKAGDLLLNWTPKTWKPAWNLPICNTNLPWLAQKPAG